MKLSLKTLRNLISEAILSSENYMEKDLIKEDLQNRLLNAIVSGKIESEDDLEKYYEIVDEAVESIKTVPYDFLVKLSKAKK